MVFDVIATNSRSEHHSSNLWFEACMVWCCHEYHVTNSKSFCLLSTSQSVKRMPYALSGHVPFFSTWHMLGNKHFPHSKKDSTCHTVYGNYLPISFQPGTLTFHCNSFQLGFHFRYHFPYLWTCTNIRNLKIPDVPKNARCLI